MTVAYRIKDWNVHFENNRTRELKHLEWVPIPTKHDSDGFTQLMSHPNGTAHYGAWVLIVEVAAKCKVRGTLSRHGAGMSQGAAVGVKAYDSESLSRVCRGSAEVFAEVLPRLLEIGWLETVNLEDGKLCEESPIHPAPSCGNPAPSCAEWKGMEGNGIEENGRQVRPVADEVKGLKYHKDARVALYTLNEASGHSYRETDTNLTAISARLSEPGVDIDGVRLMIDRQCKRWLGTNMAEYLRPTTLFGKEKFDGYYAARNAKIEVDIRDRPKVNPRNEGTCVNPINDYGALAKRKSEESMARHLARAQQGAPPEPSET